MFSLVRNSVPRAATRAFSTSVPRKADVSKVILVGRLGRDPEVKTTKTDKEYVSYVVATTNYPPPPPGPDGTRPDPGVTWHRVLSFNNSANNYLRNLLRGSRVYVEANLEIREPDRDAEPGSPAATRQVYLRHETIRVIQNPHRPTENGSGRSGSHEENSHE